MSIFELDFELSGLKIKIKSDRDDASAALSQVQNHIGNLLQTATGLGEPPSPNPPTASKAPEVKVIEAATVSSKNSLKRPKSRGNGGSDPVTYAHDEALGVPKQAWNAARKAMWMLHILEQKADRKDFTTNEITATFNQNFKHFGAVMTTNVSRDLGKVRPKGWVGVDASKDPQTWDLLGEGTKEVQRFVAEIETA